MSHFHQDNKKNTKNVKNHVLLCSKMEIGSQKFHLIVFNHTHNVLSVFYTKRLPIHFFLFIAFYFTKFSKTWETLSFRYYKLYKTPNRLR